MFLNGVEGDGVESVIGAEIVHAEVVSNVEKEALKDYKDDSHTWTYYTLMTQEHTIVFRWYGASNGYYSEEVNFAELKDSKKDSVESA